MAAELSNTNAGQENKTAEVSYANVVLNNKNECNKENIDADSNILSIENDEHPEDFEKIPDSNTLYDNLNQPDDDFIDYSGPKRKRKLAKLKKMQGSGQHSMNNTSRHHFSNKHERVKEKRYKMLPSNISVSASDDSEIVESLEQVKFVEAPIPIVNPWIKNKNAASVIKTWAEESCPLSNGSVGKYNLYSYSIIVPVLLYHKFL